MSLGFVEYRGTKINVKKRRGLLTLNLDAEFILDMDEIKGLDKLTGLQKLSMAGMITEIKGIGNLTNLEVLDLSYNMICNIECLENLTKLRIINLKKNQISTIRGLQNVKNLKVLNLSMNPVHKWAVKYFEGKKRNGAFKHPKKLVEFCEKIAENERIQEKRIKAGK